MFIHEYYSSLSLNKLCLCLLLNPERCPVLPVIRHALPDVYTSDVTSSVTFYCNPGHRFKNGATEHEFICNSDRHWLIDYDESCLGNDSNMVCHERSTEMATIYVSITSLSLDSTVTSRLLQNPFILRYCL